MYLATTPSKAEVRAEAERRGFLVAKKLDSYDICFIPEGDTRAWLGDHIQMRPGMIKDTSGNVMGEHPGAQGFIVGQRKGLALGTPAPDGKPHFVLEIRLDIAFLDWVPEGSGKPTFSLSSAL